MFLSCYTFSRNWILLLCLSLFISWCLFRFWWLIFFKDLFILLKNILPLLFFNFLIFHSRTWHERRRLSLFVLLDISLKSSLLPLLFHFLHFLFSQQLKFQLLLFLLVLIKSYFELDELLRFMDIRYIVFFILLFDLLQLLDILLVFFFLLLLKTKMLLHLRFYLLIRELRLSLIQIIIFFVLVLIFFFMLNRQSNFLRDQMVSVEKFIVELLRLREQLSILLLIFSNFFILGKIFLLLFSRHLLLLLHF